MAAQRTLQIWIEHWCGRTVYNFRKNVYNKTTSKLPAKHKDIVCQPLIGEIHLGNTWTARSWLMRAGNPTRKLGPFVTSGCWASEPNAYERAIISVSPMWDAFY